MALKQIITDSTLAKYAGVIKATPREVIFNKHLLLSTALYATASMPLTWDQGSSSVVPTLPGFQRQFGFSNSDANQLRYFVSIVYLGAGVGALLSFFINDRIGRLWSWRLYITIWIIGQLVATSAPGLTGLYAARVISGLGIGPLTVTGTMSIVEIAPAEIRGLLAVWFSVAMTVSSVCAVFCVYGVYIHVGESRLQYQIVWFSPCVFFAILIFGSFFLTESPRWLWLAGRHDEAIATLVKIRGLPEDHPRVRVELGEIHEAIQKETEAFGGSRSHFLGVLRETFTVPANLRRVQQTLVSYALAQLSGANSVTSYFVPVLRLLGKAGGTSHSLFLTGMYSLSKLFFTLIASFFFVDALGRRGSLYVGAGLQMVSDIYLGVYLKYKQEGTASDASSQGALAWIFLHAFGYAVGLFVLPYLFGGELWPNRIRSFGGALSQCFHWLFFFAMNFAVPSLLSSTHNWGAFLLFAGWCFIAICYVFLLVPETSGLSVEEIDELFQGSWFHAYKTKRKPRVIAIEAENLEQIAVMIRYHVVRIANACLVEDPATKRHQPRNYLETLEERVVYLERFIAEHTRVDDDPLTQSQGVLQRHDSASNHTVATQLPDFDEEHENPSTLGKPDEDYDEVSDLASKVGMLSFAAGAEPHYLGSSSTFAFSRVINSALLQAISRKPGGSTRHQQDKSSLPTPCLLPDYDDCVRLSDAYFREVHAQYPFLHEPSFRDWEAKIMPSDATDLSHPDPAHLFFLYMRLYAAAQLYVDDVLQLENLEAIQAYLCYAVYSLRSPAGTSVW
ncbi:hypothetical protein LTS17_004618 [Exophiala oligosperma]